MSQKVSLQSQIAQCDLWLSRLRTSGFGDRPAVREMHAQHSEAVRATLAWLQHHEAEIRAFLRLPPETRAAVVDHGETVAQLAVEIARREAIAKAGGPVR